MEGKLKESNADSRFRTIADATPVLIWTIDANGSSSFYNKTFLDFVGVKAGEDISDWNKIVHPDDVQTTLDTINTAIAERRSYSLECRLLRADGQMALGYGARQSHSWYRECRRQRVNILCLVACGSF